MKDGAKVGVDIVSGEACKEDEGVEEIHDESSGFPL